MKTPELVYVTTRELAARIGLSPITLEIWRSRNEGPPFIRVGRLIRYEVGAVDAWLSARTVRPGA